MTCNDQGFSLFNQFLSRNIDWLRCLYNHKTNQDGENEIKKIQYYMKYVKCLHPIFFFKYTFQLNFNFCSIMSLFDSMDTGSVASSALSPESTVTSLLSRSGHLQSSLMVPEHNTTFRYRDKVLFCRSGYVNTGRSFV